jgi:nucleoside-diphosphate-sugar epimerase
MTTLVTGAFGCIGSWVVKRLLAAGGRPVVYDLGDDPWRMRMLVGEAPLKDVTMVRGDIADKDALIRVMGEQKVTA